MACHRPTAAYLCPTCQMSGLHRMRRQERRRWLDLGRHCRTRHQTQHPMPHRRRPRIRLFDCRSQLATCPFCISIELGVSGSIHLSHAALTDEGGDGVRAKCRARLERHQLSGPVSNLPCADSCRPVAAVSSPTWPSPMGGISAIDCLVVAGPNLVRFMPNPDVPPRERSPARQSDPT